MTDETIRLLGHCGGRKPARRIVWTHRRTVRSLTQSTRASSHWRPRVTA